MPGRVRCRGQVNRAAVFAAAQNIDTTQAEAFLVVGLPRELAFERRCVEQGCRQKAFGSEVSFIVSPESLSLTHSEVRQRPPEK